VVFAVVFGWLRGAPQESKREMDNMLLRMSNDNMSFFEAANKTLKLQHDREMACLREELAEERKR
jgi:hypothetical protein